MSVTSTPAWKALKSHWEALRAKGFGGLLREGSRIRNFDLSLNGLRLNYAFQNATEETLSLLAALAAQQHVPEWRGRMFEGDKINATEKRAVLHTALRRKEDTPILVDGQDIMPDIRATQNRLAEFVHDVREGKRKGATGKSFRRVVNIGIGGSDLGPRLAAQALKPFSSGIEAQFVANPDAFEMQSVLKNADPAQTLFIVVSKTFTTQETLLNARMARQWLVEKLGDEAVKRHFVAVSVNAAEVEKFGIHPENTFPMWDWVGGRYSLWSAVGLSVALSIGMDSFQQLLAGAAAMDAHFQTAPLEKNMPVVLAMLGIWNRNFLGAASHAVLPYSERLRDLPRYLQQLEMESNGKSVTRDGKPTDYETAPVIFGECGTVCQHSFLQGLHQGTDAVPADFIAVLQDDLDAPENHRVLLSNLAAQMGALAFGQKDAPLPQDRYAGNRPSTLILLDKLDPFHLGMLLAMYEHKVFVQGIIWEINSFDQPGVELGKRMAKGLEKGSPIGAAEDAMIMDAFFKTLIQSK